MLLRIAQGLDLTLEELSRRVEHRYAVVQRAASLGCLASITSRLLGRAASVAREACRQLRTE